MVASSQPPAGAFPWEHPKDGAVCTELGTTQLLLVENGVLLTSFPPPSALSRWQWVHGCYLEQTDQLLVERKDHLPHPLGHSTRGGSPARLRAAALSPLGSPDAANFQCTSCSSLAWAAHDLPCVHPKPRLPICCCLLCSPACCLSSWPHTLVDPSV